METTVNELARKISKLTQEEIDNLNIILRDKYGFNSNLYKYPAGIISISNENITYDVHLIKTGSLKLQLLKRIKELFGLGLKEAKDIIDSAPIVLAKETTLSNAEAIKNELEELGATIEIL